MARTPGTHFISTILYLQSTKAWHVLGICILHHIAVFSQAFLSFSCFPGVWSLRLWVAARSTTDSVQFNVLLLQTLAGAACDTAFEAHGQHFKLCSLGTPLGPWECWHWGCSPNGWNSSEGTMEAWPWVPVLHSQYIRSGWPDGPLRPWKLSLLGLR